MGSVKRMNTNPKAQEPTLVPHMSEQQRVTYARMLRGARAERGLTQAEVAEAAGIARNTYAHMESGKQVPQAKNLWSAMLVLDIRPDRPEPEWLLEWWRIIEPLALRVPESKRGEVMGEIVRTLHDAIG